MEVNPLRAFASFLKIYSRSLTEYRGEFIGGSIFMFLNDGIFFFTLAYLGHKFGSFGGLTSDEFTAGLAIGFYAFIIGGNFFQGTRKLAVRILKGSFDTMLLRPLPIFLQTQMLTINRNAVGEIAFGIAFGCIVNPIYWPRIIIFSLIGGVIVNLWCYCLSLITIYTDMDHNRGGFDAFINFHLYPSKIFDPVTRFVALILIPGGMMSFVPMYMIHDDIFTWIYPLFVIALIIGTYLFSKHSLKKYTGAS